MQKREILFVDDDAANFEEYLKAFAKSPDGLYIREVHVVKRAKDGQVFTEEGTASYLLEAGFSSHELLFSRDSKKHNIPFEVLLRRPPLERFLFVELKFEKGFLESSTFVPNFFPSLEDVYLQESSTKALSRLVSFKGIERIHLKFDPETFCEDAMGHLQELDNIESVAFTIGKIEFSNSIRCIGLFLRDTKSHITTVELVIDCPELNGMKHSHSIRDKPQEGAMYFIRKLWFIRDLLVEKGYKSRALNHDSIVMTLEHKPEPEEDNN